MKKQLEENDAGFGSASFVPQNENWQAAFPQPEMRSK